MSEHNLPEQQIPNMAVQNVKITVKEFAAKYNDKAECYKFLAGDCGVYLPHYDNVTVWHLQDLASGKRKRILGKDVKHLMVPQYEGLAVKNILGFGGTYELVIQSLPAVDKEIVSAFTLIRHRGRG